MLELSDPVPFTVDTDEHLGLSEVQGLLSANGRALLLEYRVADTVLGALKSDVRVIEVPFAAIASLRYHSRLFGFHVRVHLRVRQQEVLAKLPGAKLGEVRLIIRRRDRAEAESFCLDAAQEIARARGAMIEERIAGRLEE